MPLVTYSALRLGLLAACFALGYWAGLRTWLLLGVAVLAAWALSYVLLAGPRDAAAVYLAARGRRRAGQGRRGGPSGGQDEAHEDALVDRAVARGDRPPTGPRPGSSPVDADTPVGDDDGPGDGRGEADAAGRRPYPGETASPRPNSAP